MKIFNLKNFAKGWFIGNFEPSIFKTDDFEITIKRYKKNDKEEPHYHKISNEYSAIVSGVFRFNERILKADDIVLAEPDETIEFECLEDGVNVVVKIPCVKNDKYIIK